jgi:hypothetical protein
MSEWLDEPIDTFEIKIKAVEGGVLIGLIELSPEEIKLLLSGVRAQLIEIMKDIEKKTGVIKNILPDGSLEIIDKDGNRFIRPPLPWEIESN